MVSSTKTYDSIKANNIVVVSSIQVDGFPNQIIDTPIGVVGYNTIGEYGPITFEELSHQLDNNPTVESITYIAGGYTTVINIPNGNPYSQEIWSMATMNGYSYRVTLNIVARDPVNGSAYSARYEYLVNQIQLIPEYILICSSVGSMGYGSFSGATIAALSNVSEIRFSLDGCPGGISITTRIDIEKTP